MGLCWEYKHLCTKRQSWYFDDKFRFRYDPVRYTSCRKGGPGRRNKRTFQEKLAYHATFFEKIDSGIPIRNFGRFKRRIKKFPPQWDDRPRCPQRNWKSQGGYKHQHKYDSAAIRCLKYQLNDFMNQTAECSCNN